MDAFTRTGENLLTCAPVELADIVGSTASGVEDSNSSSYKELDGCIRKLKYHYAIAGDVSGNNFRSVLSLEKSADEQAFASMRQVKITKFFHLIFNVYAVCKFSNIEVIYMSNKNKICIYKAVLLCYLLLLFIYYYYRYIYVTTKY